MTYDTLSQKLTLTRRARNMAVLMLIVMISANALLSWRLLQESSQTILVPTRVADGMVARGAADVRYVEAVALDAVYALYSVSPRTVEYGRTVIERLATAAQRAALLDLFDEVASDITDRNISTSFSPERIEHDLDRLHVTVHGQLRTYLDTTQVSADARKIRLIFVNEASSIRLARIERLEPDA